MHLRIPVGIDDFRALRELSLEYVDKSDLIRQLIDRAGVQVALMPRPRRFGKSLNLSMLRYWFEKRDEDLSHLFRDLSIWQAGEAYRAHFQRYPVIHLSLKDTKFSRMDRVMGVIRSKIEAVFNHHRYLLASDRLHEGQLRNFRAVVDGTAEQPLYDRALLDLCEYLHAHHGEKVVLLIDEYDEPILAGYLHGFAPEILEFMRAWFGAGLKSNVFLHRAFLTGILRVAKENLFSGLNNIGVYSLLRPELHTCFGFTEPEVVALLERTGRASMMGDVRAWYNGYLFGGEVIYNPWSVVGFLDSEAAELKPYWLSTSSNDLVREMLVRYSLELQTAFETLLEGGGVEQVLEENVVLSDVRRRQSALWSLLVFSGYLKAEKAPADAQGRIVHRLSIPNREVRHVYADTFRGWMEERMEGHGGSIDELRGALLTGDAERLEEQLQAFVKNILSYHDTGKLYPERVYHAFVVGLLAALEPGHQVRSNRESGKGRPDVIIRPIQAGRPGAVLELKVARAGRVTLDQALADGLAQLAGGDYGAELRASGAAPIHAFAVAFDGKEVRVRLAGST